MGVFISACIYCLALAAVPTFGLKFIIHLLPPHLNHQIVTLVLVTTMVPWLFVSACIVAIFLTIFFKVHVWKYGLASAMLATCAFFYILWDWTGGLADEFSIAVALMLLIFPPVACLLTERVALKFRLRLSRRV